MLSSPLSVRIFLNVFLFIGFCSVLVTCQRPHIVFIIADDLGWNDVSYHGSDQIQTPNIDALAYNGIILNSHYAQQTCTPSRTALLTGKYPMRYGMQGRPLNPGEAVSLPAAKLLPEYFKDLGYTTHMVGKWHLGFERWNSTPTYRGFDTFLGSYSGYNSYYDYVPQLKFNGKVYNGFDLRRGTEPAWDLVGQYATDVYTEAAQDIIKNHDKTKSMFLMVNHVAPHTGNEGKWLEAPQEAVDKFKHIIDVSRRSYAGMVSKLDDSVGAIMQSLQENSMLDNTVVIFMSDNGAPSVGMYQNWGSNYPLRGIKGTLFEGGVRVPAIIYSPLLPQSRRVAKDLIHISDWLPTLMTAAGGDVNLEDIDGVDQWSSLQYDFSSPRTDALLNINEITRNAAIRYNNWKLIVGSSNNGTFDEYFGEAGTENIRDIEYNTSAVYDSPAGQAISKIQFPPTSEAEYTFIRKQATIKCLNSKQKKNPCSPSNGEVCLYDIPSDPCEENNLVPLFPSVVRRLKRELVDFRSGLKPQLSQDPDIQNADPKLFDYTWNPWLDCADITCKAS